jgi:hypothetical protein
LFFLGAQGHFLELVWFFLTRNAACLGTSNPLLKELQQNIMRKINLQAEAFPTRKEVVTI